MYDYLTYYLAPLALRLGMTLDQFWDDAPAMFWVYLEAYEQERKARFEYDNTVAFLQGQYNMLAIAQCLQAGKRTKQIFPKKPFDVSGTPNENNNKRSQREAAEIRQIEWKARVDAFNKSRGLKHNG